MLDDFSDDQVAAILSKEAKDCSVKYSADGMSAFLPSKPPANKPKPNTRFLRNLVRETDSHNAALLAKEATDSRTRLEQLGTKDALVANGIRRRQLGNIAAVLNENAPKRQIVGGSHRPKRNRVASSNCEEMIGRLRDHEEHHQNRSKSTRDITEGKDVKDVTLRNGKHRSYRNVSKRQSPPEKHRDDGSRHRLRSRSPCNDTNWDPKRRDRSPGRRSRLSTTNHPDGDLYGRESRRKSLPQANSDSDPLEAIVGPLPPPKVKSRGRGTTASSSGIDARFSDNYNPALDLVAENQDNDGDGWELVLDRVKWQQQGADRLRAAGFTEKEIQGWKSGKKSEVKWTASGKEREWDRGKLVDGDGSAEWGKLDGM